MIRARRLHIGRPGVALYRLLGAVFVATASCAHDGGSRGETPVTSRLVSPPPSATDPSAADPRRQAEPVDAEPDPFPVLHGETIGPFAIGMSKEAALRLAPSLRQVGPVVEEGATAEWVESWDDPGEGLSVAFSSTEEEAPKLLRSIQIEAPSRLVTRRGVALGAAHASVLAEYGDVLDRDFPPTPTMIIAGSLYGGMIFHFEGGLVKSIFLGAGAE